MRSMVFSVPLLLAVGFMSCRSGGEVSEGSQVDVQIPSGWAHIAGTFTLPYRDTGKPEFEPGFLSRKSNYYTRPQPAVLLLPGFLGEREGLPVAGTASPAEGGKPLGIWELTAMELAREGYASLRIDYRNSGKSPGRWQDISLTEQLEDVENALKWLEKQPHIDGKRLIVLGFSQGGMLAAQISPSPLVAAVVLWSAPVNFFWHKRMFPEGFIDEVISAKGTGTFDTPWGETVTMGSSYFHSRGSITPLKAIAEFEGPLLVIAGSRDTLVSPQPDVSLRFIEAHRLGEESLVMLNADHTFDSFVSPDKIQEAISETVKWLDDPPGVFGYPRIYGSKSGRY